MSWRSRRQSPLSLFIAGALGLSLVISVAAAQAPNSVYIEPDDLRVAPGGSVVVDLVAEPAATTLAAWVVEVAFDPGVVTTSTRRCDPFDTPPGAAGAAGCEVVDTNGDGVNDTAKTYGGAVYSSGDGLSAAAVLATIEFTAGDTPGCSDLRVRVVAFADAQGNETHPAVSHGRVCAGAGSSPAPGGGSPTPAQTDGSGAPSGDGGAGASPASPTGTASEGSTTPAAGFARTPVQATNDGAGRVGVGSDGSDGPGIIVWLLLGTGLAAAASGGLLWLWRRR